MSSILIVDDEPSARRLLRTTLTKAGYEVIEAANGVEGLRKAQEEKPNLIIADILMPIRDGHQLTHDLRNNPATALVPIIMLTGLSEEKDELKAFQEGVDDYVVKPVRLWGTEVAPGDGAEVGGGAAEVQPVIRAKSRMKESMDNFIVQGPPH